MLALAKTGYAAIQDTTARAAKTTDIVTGVVVDENNRPLNGATIAIKGKTTIIKTNEAGNFSLKGMAGDILVFSYPNHYTSEIALKTSVDKLNVRMLDKYLQTREKLDILYGTVNANASLGAIGTIYTNQITTTPATIYQYALPGQLAGLYTQQTSGFTATNNSNPLSQGIFSFPIVVTAHGIMPNDNTEIGISVRGHQYEGVTIMIDGIQEDISSVDPESIESIAILKDALSTVLLGMNSSTPILQITTKKPEIGQPRISFTTETAIQQSLGVPSDPLTAYQWAYLYNEGLENSGAAPFYSTADLLAYKNHTDPYGHPDVNWKKLLLNNYSPMSTDKLNVSGGTDVSRYNISLDYIDQGGIFKEAPNVDFSSNNSLSRYTLNSSVSVKVNKNLSVNLQIYGRVEQVTTPGAGYGPILTGLEVTPNNAYPVYNPNGTFGGNSASGNVANLEDNLLSMSQYSGYQITKLHNVLANLDLDYKLNNFIQGLSFKAKANLGVESQILIDRSYQNSTYQYVKVDSSISYNSLQSSTAITNDFSSTLSATTSFEQFSFDYDRAFGKNNITAQAFYDSRSLSLSYDIAAITTDKAFKADYNYDGKYFAEGIINYSGYNRYPPGHQNGLFYAAGLGWQMAKEAFIKDNIDWINSWKWRATFGQTGNNSNAGYYTYKQTYTNNGAGSYNFGLNYPSGATGFTEVSPIANPNESWERAQKLDIGADISLLKNHLQITADYYHEKYYDLLETTGGSIAILGAAYPTENIGTNLYTGEELTLTYQNHIDNLNYFISGNGTIAKSKVIYFDEEPQMYPWLARTGLPVTAMFGYDALGFYTAQDVKDKVATIAGYSAQPGDIRYKDLNGDGVINQYDQTAIGGLKPLVYYGATLGFNYKGFSFSAILQGVFNREINVNNELTDGFEGLYYGLNAPYGQAYQNVLNRWTPETATTATYPRLDLPNGTYNPNNQLTSTFYIKSGDYFRLKNAEIGYTLPNEFTKRLKLSGIRVFIDGENLFTIAGYKGFPGMDPEVNGVGSYPIQRVLNAGLTVKL
jgi:TonB-linked SusC/RagA family outer membrane protein